MSETTIYFNAGGIDFEVLANYRAPRPAPKIDPNNYDNTKCDPGDPGEFEIKKVIAGGKEIECDFEEFKKFFTDEIAEALDL